MPDYNQEDLKTALKKLNISNGDSIFLTTGLGMLGLPETKKKITC